MANTGMLTIQELLAVEDNSITYGLDNLQEILAADLAAHNQIVVEMVGELCEVTTEHSAKYGASQDQDMTEVDEFGRGESQQPTSGSNASFPLRKFTRPISWTHSWFQQATVADVARSVIGVQTAHLKEIQKQIKYAVFRASNYTFTDHLINKVDLPVKRFANADGQAIPNGPNGEVYDAGVHTHFDAIAGLTNAALHALIDDVVEHGHGNMVKVYINRGDETTVSALADFKPYSDPRIILGTHMNQAGGQLDISRLDNRAIGIFGAAEVWVKPWVPANYAFCADVAAPEKALAFRQRVQVPLQGLYIAAEYTNHPMYARLMEADFGIGTRTRTNGAVLYFGGGAWVDAF
ncbi:MAG: hypothetical protein GY943_36170 [Chloroflexi bacterium]|nr:hypothetical protein [Chloroflexota bacterium]